MCAFIILISFSDEVSTEGGIRDNKLSVVLHVDKISIQILVSLNRTNPVAFKHSAAF